MTPSLQRAADVLLGGGVIAYPTEGVFGLGCMPDDEQALARLLRIKQRDPSKGLILVADLPQRFEGWVDDAELKQLPAVDPQQPVTWIAAGGPRAHPLVTGDNDGIAVRVTSNPVAAALCSAVESPITSTSANLSGRPVVRNKFALRRTFGALVDYIVPGDCGPASGPSEIRRLKDGAVLRPGQS
ncbi:MAG: L-threonylcarbamoyladenylate synthase [Woeseiaceae bacterium]|nr:L-threonylcarbamoyladenylate synthase [Woeseiaceae bacterium]